MQTIGWPSWRPWMAMWKLVATGGLGGANDPSSDYLPFWALYVWLYAILWHHENMCFRFWLQCMHCMNGWCAWLYDKRKFQLALQVTQSVKTLGHTLLSVKTFHSKQHVPRPKKWSPTWRIPDWPIRVAVCLKLGVGPTDFVFNDNSSPQTWTNKLGTLGRRGVEFADAS